MALDLILTGALSLKAPAGAFVDVSDEVLKFVVSGAVAEVKVPATLATPAASKPGQTSFELTIGYFATDGTDGKLFDMLWTAVQSASKTLEFKGTMRDGAKGPTNPQWTGEIVVSGADIGGEQDALSVGEITCGMTGAPVKDITV